jgi:hypothetical protein
MLVTPVEAAAMSAVAATAGAAWQAGYARCVDAKV